MRVKDHNKQTGAKLKTYRYYNDMDGIYGNKPNVNPVSVASSMRANENTSCSEDCADDSATDNDQHKGRKSKVERHLSSWAEQFIEHSKERAEQKEQHQAQKLATIEDATKTFRDVMQKIFEKFLNYILSFIFCDKKVLFSFFLR